MSLDARLGGRHAWVGPGWPGLTSAPPLTASLAWWRPLCGSWPLAAQSPSCSRRMGRAKVQPWSPPLPVAWPSRPVSEEVSRNQLCWTRAGAPPVPQPGSATQDSQNSPCVTPLWPLTSSSGFPERSSTWVSNIYIIYLHSRPLKSLRAPAAGQGCVHKAKCKCVNALKTESGHKLHTTGPRSGHATARTLAIVQPRTPVAYSHAPLGRAPLGGGGGGSGRSLGRPWVGGRRAACERQMWTDTGRERCEWPPGVQHDVCAGEGEAGEMTHETCVGTCPCRGRVPESRGRPPSGCGPQSHRLGAGPLRRAPTQQAQKCLHKVQLRQELPGASRAQCVHTCCACAVPGQGRGER